MQNNTPAIYSVTQLNTTAKALLESGLGSIWLTGEISNFVSPSSGHWYFSLKDNRSQVRCAMFLGQTRSVNFKPGNGSQILARVKVSLYEPRGEYQLVVQSMQSAGEGALQQAYEALKGKLAGQGLFAQTAKKPIPAHPRCVGIISSPTGAALQDIIAVLKRRSPNLPLIIYPSMVQGESAAAMLNHAIQVANQRAEVDVLIVARGGGSLEDLWCFNDEQLAHSIYHSQIPIISAVGHEIDFTICDLVSDLRAATPSAAAEQVAGEKEYWIQNLQQKKQRLLQYFIMNISIKKQSQTALKHQLELFHPKQKLQVQSQRLDELQLRLNSQMQRLTLLHRATNKHILQNLQKLTPAHSVHYGRQATSSLSLALRQAMMHQLSNLKEKQASQNAQLDAVSPLATLIRGYGVITDEQDRVIRSVDAIKLGQHLNTQLSKGSFKSKVMAINE